MEDIITFDNFKSMVSESLGIDVNVLNSSTSFRDDLGIDSLSVMNFIIKLEHKYKIRINLNNIWELNSFGEVYTYFNHCLESKFKNNN